MTDEQAGGLHRGGERGDVLDLCYGAGFPPSDLYDCGPGVIVHGYSQAAVDAADEIGIAVIATSTTLAAVFVPVAFMPGVTGKFFREFGWTAAAAVLFSLLVARLLTPMLAGHFMKGEPRDTKDSKLMRRYLDLVEHALAHRARVGFDHR